jgi:hypothetical protein
MYVWERFRNDLSLLLKGVQNPHLTGFEVNRLYYQLRYGEKFNSAGIDVFEDETWDNLILLDSCRYREYKELTPFEEPVETRVSRGSSSKQFIRGNFSGKQLTDTVYVSGNQWYLKLHDELQCRLHKFRDVERDTVGERVPHPETLTEAALEYADRYPRKRLVVHYMQPHRPYLGARRHLFVDDTGDGRVQLRDILSTVRSGEATWDDVMTAYRDNLRIVLESVEALVEQLEGKTVISADHGELLGERTSPIPIRWFGHPESIYVDTLVNVPWHVVSNGQRREIVAENPNSELVVENTDKVEENLRRLGYL